VGLGANHIAPLLGYRFEKKANDGGYLCHKDHYDKYFKPSINILSSTRLESPMDVEVSSETSLYTVPPAT